MDIEQAFLEPKVHTVTTHFQSNLKPRARKSRTVVKNTHSFELDDAAWLRPAYEYNPDTALAGIALALSSYQSKQSTGFGYILDTFESFGFCDVDISSYFHRTEDDPSDFETDTDLVAYGIATKRLLAPDGTKIPVVAVVVRGTTGTMEWTSNGNIADSVTDGDYSHLKYHEGFKKSEVECCAHLKRYLERHDLVRPETRIYVFGHSRGACIANLLGPDLDEGAIEGITAGQVVTFTYASSGTTFDEKYADELYRNVYNFVYPEDFIPRLPMSWWGLKRYGTTYYFQSIATAHARYDELHEEIWNLFKTVAETEYLSFYGMYPTDTFVRKGNDLSSNTAQYYTRKHLAGDRFITFRQYFQLFTNECAEKGFTHLENTGEMLEASRGPFESFLSYFFVHQMMRPEIPFVHSAGAYMSRLQVMRERGMDMNTLGTPDCIRVCIYGDVKLEAHDREGNLVGRLENGHVDKSVRNHPHAVSMAHDAETNAHYAWIPDDGSITLRYRLEGQRASRQIKIGVARQALEGDLYAQEFYEQTIEADVVYTFDKEPPVMPDLDTGYSVGMQLLKVSESAPIIDVEAKAVGRGDCRGALHAFKGERAAVVAYEAPGARFEGWYEDESCEGDCLSREKTYVVDVENDRTLFALFM